MPPVATDPGTWTADGGRTLDGWPDRHAPREIDFSGRERRTAHQLGYGFGHGVFEREHDRKSYHSYMIAFVPSHILGVGAGGRIRGCPVPGGVSTDRVFRS